MFILSLKLESTVLMITTRVELLVVASVSKSIEHPNAGCEPQTVLWYVSYQAWVQSIVSRFSLSVPQKLTSYGVAATQP